MNRNRKNKKSKSHVMLTIDETSFESIPDRVFLSKRSVNVKLFSLYLNSFDMQRMVFLALTFQKNEILKSNFEVLCHTIDCNFIDASSIQLRKQFLKSKHIKCFAFLLQYSFFKTLFEFNSKPNLIYGVNDGVYLQLALSNMVDVSDIIDLILGKTSIINIKINKPDIAVYDSVNDKIIQPFQPLLCNPFQQQEWFDAAFSKKVLLEKEVEETSIAFHNTQGAYSKEKVYLFNNVSTDLFNKVISELREKGLNIDLDTYDPVSAVEKPGMSAVLTKNRTVDSSLHFCTL